MGVRKYKQAYQKWTWERRRNDYGAYILSRIQLQCEGECTPYAIAYALEAHMRLCGFTDIVISRDELMQFAIESKKGVARTKAWRVLKVIQEKGVLQEEAYKFLVVGHDLKSPRHRIKDLFFYDVKNCDHLRQALEALTCEGPLVGVIKISQNYNECWRSKHVYRFDPSKEIIDDKTKKGITHCVCIVAFALKSVDGNRVPCFVSQDSQGPGFGAGGYVHIDITSVVELYSFKMLD